MIKLNKVTIQRGTKILLSDADLTIHASQRWGVIGENGAGKSSLFKLLLGELHEDSGQLNLPQNLRIAHLAQETPATQKTALDYVIDGDEELRRLEKDIEQTLEKDLDNGNVLGRLYSQMEHIDGYGAKTRALKLFDGLGFKPKDETRKVAEFSGGWRIRLNLAKALMCRSDLLLLDEPTNHLDLDATLWLEQWLKRYAGTLLIISHDRDFLDNVVGYIVNFEGQKLISYTGNYSSYEHQKADRLAQQSAAFDKQQERIAEIENFVRRFRAKATKAKQAQSRLKELERMEKIAPAHVDSPFNFIFPVADKVPSTLLNVTHAAIGYGDSPTLSNVNLSILASSRIGLLGHNGSGKSTLIKMLANGSNLMAGDRSEALHLKIGYFAQHQLEALDMKASCATHVQRLSPEATEQEIRNFLGGFGFQGDRAFETIHHFSGGEKARLALALVAWQKPNLLLMDEPTNHLDIEMRQALTMALQGFEGAIITVSHDRHLLKNTVDEFWLVDKGKVCQFDGSLEDYQNWLADQTGQPSASGQSNKSETPDKNNDKKALRQQAAAKREQLKPLTNAIKKLETLVEKYQTELTQIEVQLGDPTLYEGNSESLPLLLKQQAEVRTKLEAAEFDWMEKSEELENLTLDK